MSRLTTDLLKEKLPYIVGGSVALASLAAVLMKTFFKKPKKIWPADTVILHQVGRGPYAPSLSPFPLKLECYLRMARIPYQNDHKSGMSSKRKTPWITYNGEDIADSQFSIDFLNKKLGVDLYKHLSLSDRAIAFAFQKMVEEHLYWCLVERRWVKHMDISYLQMALNKAIPKFIFYLLRIKVTYWTYGQGFGRHTDAEQWTIYTNTMEAMSNFLGKKPFFMGDEPCEVDCAMFGMLAQFKWQLPGSPHETYLEEEAQTLSEYCDRMKETFWPDWDKCITHGGTKKPEA